MLLLLNRTPFFLNIHNFIMHCSSKSSAKLHILMRSNLIQQNIKYTQSKESAGQQITILIQKVTSICKRNHLKGLFIIFILYSLKNIMIKMLPLKWRFSWGRSDGLSVAWSLQSFCKEMADRQQVRNTNIDSHCINIDVHWNWKK